MQKKEKELQHQALESVDRESSNRLFYQKRHSHGQLNGVARNAADK